MALFQSLHVAIRICDEYLGSMERRGLVQSVLQIHFQETLRILNEKDGLREPAGTSRGAANAAETEDGRHLTVPKTLFIPEIQLEAAATKKEMSLLQQLDSASSREKHGLLSQINLVAVRKRVIEVVYNQLKSEVAREEDPLEQAETKEMLELMKGQHDQQINDIWCALIVRMVCWLMLHDFHPKDAHIDKGNTYGSRLAVYIT
ncbi:hypothetical protein CkaCkLH20_06812 [Colletotrichum karsti]|uniref:Uncharacterized protein n=1 Tax=Colletotrichum karsti TaxID=1095194 RepID=A0A9P6LKC0_9PEZI|nr:uncharacterized protein CkaCkLH20_06812 [Colletotrichum karsti]KAF9875880.1 hypothetical protein CkaCkLH20_06812 [Colletotrichum karsti]